MAEAKAPAQSTSASTTAKKVQFAHTVPPPQDMNRSKLDWLLLINEEYFQEELKTVVCNFQLAILICNSLKVASNFYHYYPSLLMCFLS